MQRVNDWSDGTPGPKGDGESEKKHDAATVESVGPVGPFLILAKCLRRCTTSIEAVLEHTTLSLIVPRFTIDRRRFAGAGNLGKF